MSDDRKRTTPRSTPVPAFDPAPSGDFAGRAVAGAGVAGVVIGRIAVWVGGPTRAGTASPRTWTWR
jgi:hypothetical protein